MFQLKNWAEDGVDLPTHVEQLSDNQWKVSVAVRVELVAPSFKEAVIVALKILFRYPICYTSTVSSFVRANWVLKERP